MLQGILANERVKIHLKEVQDASEAQSTNAGHRGVEEGTSNSHV